MNTRLLAAVVLSASSLTAHGGVIPVTDPAIRAGHETIFKALLPEVEKALARPARLPEPDTAPLPQPAS